MSDERLSTPWAENFFSTRHQIVQLAATGALVAGWAATLLLLGYWNVDFSQPLSLGGDNLQVWNFAKSYIDGYGMRLNPSLAFPGVQDNNFFPSFDFSYKLILWISSRFTSNPANSMHVLYFAGISMMYLVSAASLIRIGFRPLFAAIGSIAIVVTPYFFSRALGHDFLSLYYSVPAGGALALIIGTMSTEDTVKSLLRDKFIIAFTFLAGTSGLYYGFFTCMFTCVAGLCLSIQTRRIAPLVVAVITSIAIFALLVLTGYNTGLMDVISGATPQIYRSPAEHLGLGLNLSDAVHVLSDSGISKWAMAVYVGFMPLIAGSVGLFEWPGLLLTVVIFLCPVFYLAASADTNKWARLLSLAAALIAFGIIYSIRGGIAFYFNLFIAPQVRATARVIPFLGFFAAIVVLAIAEVSLRSRYLVVKIIVPVVLMSALLIAIIPCIDTMHIRQRAFVTKAKNLEDLPSIRTMLQRKDEAGLMTILELPHYPWPEFGDIRGYNPYSLQTPYIMDRPGSPTRWSYGGSSPQASFKAVDDFVKQTKSGIAKAAATTFGFDGILIEKGPLTPEELSAMQANVEASGSRKLFEDKFRALYAIVP